MLVGSTPGDNKNINGVKLLESSRALFTSNTRGSVNCRPSFSVTKFDIANDNLSNLKLRTNKSFLNELMFSFHLPANTEYYVWLVRFRRNNYLPTRLSTSGLGDMYHSFHSIEKCPNDFSIPRKPGTLSNSEMLSQFTDGNQAEKSGP